MKEYILDKSGNNNYINKLNSNKETEVKQKEGKKKNLNYLNLIIIFTAIGVLLSLLIIIFITLSKKH